MEGGNAEEAAEGGIRRGRSAEPGGGRRKVRPGAAADPTGSQGQPARPELQRPRGNGPPRDLTPPLSRSHGRGRHLQRAASHPLPQARRPALPQPRRLGHRVVGTPRGLARAGGREAPAHPHAAAGQVGIRGRHCPGRRPTFPLASPPKTGNHGSP